MTARDVLAFSGKALTGFRTRTLLMILAMAMGVASVVLLTALGDGARRYVIGEFSALGTNLVIVLPGRSETAGGPPPLIGVTPRDLTLDDAMAIARSSLVRHLAPLTLGLAPASRMEREREVTVLGSTAALYSVRQLEMGQGRFLPAGDPDQAEPVCVLGYTVKTELFSGAPAIGQWIRIGDRRFRVIGVLAEKGQSLGTNMDDVVIIPVAAAQSLLNTSSLFRILVEAHNRDLLDRTKEMIVDVIRERHDGEDDVTVITQDAVLSTFDRILGALTLAVAGIASISLFVAGILIMNVMLVAVSQRTEEIGLLKALGTPREQILRLFLSEAALLSLLGAAVGLILAAIGSWWLGRAFPNFPIEAPMWSLAAAVSIALGTGLVFGWLPANRAAALDPVAALTGR